MKKLFFNKKKPSILYCLNILLIQLFHILTPCGRILLYNIRPPVSQCRLYTTHPYTIEGGTILQAVEAVDRPIPIFLWTHKKMLKLFKG